jgi:RimJ/RimL family protein N-acetyltransferase
MFSFFFIVCLPSKHYSNTNPSQSISTRHFHSSSLLTPHSSLLTPHSSLFSSEVGNIYRRDYKYEDDEEETSTQMANRKKKLQMRKRRRAKAVARQVSGWSDSNDTNDTSGIIGYENKRTDLPDVPERGGDDSTTKPRLARSITAMDDGEQADSEAENTEHTGIDSKAADGDDDASATAATTDSDDNNNVAIALTVSHKVTTSSKHKSRRSHHKHKRTHVDIVRLQTERLVLQSLSGTTTAADHTRDQTVAQIFNDRETMVHLPYFADSKPNGWSVEDVQQRRIRRARQAVLHKAFNFDLCEKKTGALIGICGFTLIGNEPRIDATSTSNEADDEESTAAAADADAADATTNNDQTKRTPAEVKRDRVRTGQAGIIIGKAHWGHGYAVEAHLAFLDYGFDHLKLQQVSFGTDKDNTTMRGFFEKYGFAWLGVGKPEAPNSYNYAITKDQWVSQVRRKLVARVARATAADRAAAAAVDS